MEQGCADGLQINLAAGTRGLSPKEMHCQLEGLLLYVRSGLQDIFRLGGVDEHVLMKRDSREGLGWASSQGVLQRLGQRV